MPRIELPLDKLRATERFQGFQDLIQKRVQDVLLVATLYDYYILSQDGRLSEQFLGEFLELNLRHTPNLTHAFSGKEALERARESSRYDLIITSVELGDMNVLELVSALRAEGIETPVVLLAYDRRELSQLEKRDVSGIERMFLWQGDVRILVAIVKYMEDKLNVAYDTGVVGVPAIVLVENSIRYYSSFLPVIYTELVKHSHGLLPEGLNLTDKILRIRAGPKILLASDYEEAWNYFDRYADEILGHHLRHPVPAGGRHTARRRLRARARGAPAEAGRPHHAAVEPRRERGQGPGDERFVPPERLADAPPPGPEVHGGEPPHR